MQTIADQLKSALETIEQTTLCANRPPNSVQLLAVSKTKPVSDIVLAYKAGQRKFGENYVQEGVEKIQILQELSDIQWHFIGPLQSNKSALVAEHFDWVQSIDRLKIASRLSQQRPVDKGPLQVCIQVNISAQESKSGISAAELPALAEQIATLPQLTLRGIMAIPAPSQNEQQQEAVFAQLHDLFVQLQARYPQVDTLSMGMSADLHSAIKAGSTMVRLGTAIFGHRG
jgi:pyridoxal phosphate enzyme (YggS family)